MKIILLTSWGSAGIKESAHKVLSRCPACSKCLVNDSQWHPALKESPALSQESGYVEFLCLTELEDFLFVFCYRGCKM